jgi:hypothetical protein
MMEGMRSTMMLARRLRHWVVRSARRRLEKTDAAGVSVMAGATVLDGIETVGEVMEEDMSLVFLFQ